MFAQKHANLTLNVAADQAQTLRSEMHHFLLFFPQIYVTYHLDDISISMTFIERIPAVSELCILQLGI